MSLIRKFFPVEGWFYRVKPPAYFHQLDQEICELATQKSLKNNDYHTVFRYFLEGVYAYRSSGFAQILYPGVPGTRGRIVEGLEGFARTAPTLAAWINSGRPNEIKLNNGLLFNICHHLTQGISNGTNPQHPEFWGAITDYDQRTVEAGDIALTVWILFKSNPDILEPSIIQNIITWLEKVNSAKIYGGNWHLFKLIINTVLKSLGENRQAEIDTSYNEFKSYSVGDGWFGDGFNGFVDYYNVWQMQYYLYWFYVMEPSYDNEYLQKVFEEFSQGYKYMLSTAGTPMFGRSACYRLAIAAPLLINSAANKTHYSLSRRALDASWLHYLSHKALKGGIVTQGYYSERPELLENYSGRGSSLWSLRALTVAFYQPEDSAFWLAPAGKLPIEETSFEVFIAGPQFTITGDKKTQRIVLTRHKTYFSDSNSNQDIRKLAWFRRFMQVVLRRPLREEHLNIKYGRKEYNSDRFFCP